MKQITCPECHGKGEIPLPDWVQSIMRLFRTAKVELTTAEVLDKLDDSVTRNAINQRLERLRDMDFLKRRRVGRWWHYSRAK